MDQKITIIFLFFITSFNLNSQSKVDIDFMNYLFADYSEKGSDAQIIDGKLCVSDDGHRKIIELKDITDIEYISKYDFIVDVEHMRIKITGKWKSIYGTTKSESDFEFGGVPYKYFASSSPLMEINMGYWGNTDGENFDTGRTAATELLKKICGFEYGVLPNLTKEAIGGIADMKPFNENVFFGKWQPVFFDIGRLETGKIEKDSLIALLTKMNLQKDEKLLNWMLSFKKSLLIINNDGGYEFIENGKMTMAGTYILDPLKREITCINKATPSVKWTYSLKKGRLSMLFPNTYLSLHFEKL